MDEFDESSSVERPKPSKTPSWIMLGFLLGALFVWALPRPRPPRDAAPPPVAPVLSASAARPRVTDVEAAFEAYGHQFALWDGEISYVCLWDSTETRTFRDCFQVLRRGDDLFFRSVPRPRNLRAREGVPKESPLEFLNPVPETRGIFGLPAGSAPEAPPP